jgi:hypothetical protein
VFGKLLELLLHRRSTHPMPKPNNDTIDKFEQIHCHLRRDIATGFYDLGQIRETAVDVYGDDEQYTPSEVEREVRRMLSTLISEHEAAQKTWPARTDCDRLDAAFVALENDGVVARQNFSCCGSCGSSEIWDEVQVVRNAGGPTRGYVFYHQQDTESAIEGDGLYLNYGSCNDGEKEALGVAAMIVAQLEAHGLITKWNGTWNQRIGIEIDWKRRRDFAE